MCQQHSRSRPSDLNSSSRKSQLLPGSEPKGSLRWPSMSEQPGKTQRQAGEKCTHGLAGSQVQPWPQRIPGLPHLSYTHTHTQQTTYTANHTHTHRANHIHTYMHMQQTTHIHIYTHTANHIHTQPHTYNDIHIHTANHTHSKSHIHTHSKLYTHTHTEQTTHTPQTTHTCTHRNKS